MRAELGVLRTSVMGELSRLTHSLQAGARLLCLGFLTLLVTLPCESGVGAVTFAFSGFKEESIYLVSGSSWIYDSPTGCFYFDPPDSGLYASIPGRFLYPGLVQMIDPGTTTVKSFSTTFIYQIQIRSTEVLYTGPGMAFIVVPDNSTVGGPLDFMGLITNETESTVKNYESDDHTFGVELDTNLTPEFNDLNSNHFGVNLASMNSTYSFKPTYDLAARSVTLYQQLWIDYFEADSRIDISFARYKQGKPVTAQGSYSGLDLSLLKESMYLGFSTAQGVESSNVVYVCAWSFSNDDNIPAPSITLLQDATPSTPPPPSPRVPPPPPPKSPVAAPSLPPLAAIPSPPPASVASPPPASPRSPAPDTSSPSPTPVSNPPPSKAPNPSPPNPPPPSSAPLPSPASSPASPNTTTGGTTTNLGLVVGVPVGVVGFIGVLALSVCILRWWLAFLSSPYRIFTSHTGGPDGSEKNFALNLHKRMKKSYRWSVSKWYIRFFIDRDNIECSEVIWNRILEELHRTDLGIVVVTDDFFRAKWPMTELIAFVEAAEKDATGRKQGRKRVLPLFYKLSPEEVRRHLEAKTWEPDWVRMGQGNHPLGVGRCKHAVSWLCSPLGLEYGYRKRDRDEEYIVTICEKLHRIVRKERSFTSFIWRTKLRPWCVRLCCRPGMAIN